jgi:Na+-transporting methylmalonyl-CoA/oxaloacetate decarboxylase gamma subunit
MSIPKTYWTEFRKLSFLDRHSIVNAWMSVVFAILGLLVSVVALMATIQLQSQSNELQTQTFIREQNERNAERVKEVVKAFALANGQSKAP